MSKRRKYDVKNKRSFIIILILAILIVGIFSLFIYRYSKASKIEYLIEAGTLLQDVEKNYITLDDDASLKIRWNKDYYLVYNDEKINLGNKLLAYSNLTNNLKLYGTFYEITNEGKVIENKNETILRDMSDSKFYKLDDREYLLVDKKIQSDDRSITVGGYLLVELDKAGNAKLSNDKINLKTISPTILNTSKYSFDIANEILKFGDYEIDLKKIIGSTNQYVPEEEKIEQEEKPSSNNNMNIGIGTGVSGGGAGNIINGADNDNSDTPDMDEILDKVKMTSVVKIVEGITQIDIDYVIYDPYNEYQKVYVLVKYPDRGDEEIPLSTKDNHLTIGGLSPNTEYSLEFMYATYEFDEESEKYISVSKRFDAYTLKTKLPQYSISIYKISKVENQEAITYKVNLQKGFDISKVNVELRLTHMVNGEEIEYIDDKGYVLVPGNNMGKFSISGLDIVETKNVILTIKSVEADGQVIPVENSSYSFRLGDSNETNEENN